MITPNPKHILLADDSMLIRARLGHILEEAGHHVTLCIDGSAVIETLQGGNIDFDLIILDMNMPHINGFAVLEWMNVNGYMDGFPVLCMTDFYDINKVSKIVVDLGAEGLLIKGLSPSQTIDSVNKILFRETESTRNLVRLNTSIDARFTMAHKNFNGTILNLSLGGLFLKTDARLHDGYTLALNFELPGFKDSSINSVGRVKWITPADKKNEFFTGAGIEFKVLTTKNKNTISEFLNSQHCPINNEKRA